MTDAEKRILDRHKVREVIERAISSYNYLRAPEAVAKLIEVRDDTVLIEFSGSYCETCGLYDWIEDFKYVLEDLGVEADIVDIVEPKNAAESRRVAIFKLRNNVAQMVRSAQELRSGEAERNIR